MGLFRPLDEVVEVALSRAVRYLGRVRIDWNYDISTGKKPEMTVN